MPQDPADSMKAQREQVRDQMRDHGCTVAQIAAELSRRFALRPRLAWRHARGWTQGQLAREYNTAHPGARLSDRRVSAHEHWPHGGTPPSLHYLANLAATFGHGCTPAQLVDVDDLAELTPADRCLLTTGHPLPPDNTTAPGSDASCAPQPGSGDAEVVWDHPCLVHCDSRGIPLREEVRMAADESAQFLRWSASTNVDDGVLEQLTADVAELARSAQIDPPALTYVQLLNARDDVFCLIAGHQQPRHTTALYEIASQITAMLATVTLDLGYPHAANAHARTALHCAEMSGHTSLRVDIRRIQSSIVY
ncbi:MAG: hypothetical protein ACRDTC_19765 [Pseudonocardiaceae bacterium]